MKRAVLDRLLAARAEKRPVVLATRLATGEQALIEPYGEAEDGEADDGEADDGEADAGEPAFIDAEVRAAARVAAQSDRSEVIERPGEVGEVFLHVFNPPLRLVIIGAVHIAQALCPMATLAGFAVTVVDPRTAFASAERFPGVALSTEWPDAALRALKLDRRSAVVTLTHDPKLDEPGLVAALESEAFYIGALGSKKTQGGRLNRLRKQGFDDSALARIHGPVGLDIGAKSAAEIAVSILGQIILRLRRGDS